MSSDFVLIPMRSDTLAQVLAARKDGESIDRCIARITKDAGAPKRPQPIPMAFLAPTTQTTSGYSSSTRP